MILRPRIDKEMIGGDSYRSAIFYQNSDEKLQAEGMIEIVNNSGRWMREVVTTLESFDGFYEAE